MAKSRLPLLQNRPDRLWSPHTLVFNGYEGSFQGVSGLGLKLAPHLHLMPKLRINGVIPLLSPIRPHCMDWNNFTSDRPNHKLVAQFYRKRVG